MSTKTRAYGGPLQLKVLMALMESPSFGTDLMKKLNISSSGTMYPELKLLHKKGLIKIMAKIKRKKYYSLSEKGRESIQSMLLDMSRKYFSAYINPYLQPLIQLLMGMIKLTPSLKILSNWEYEPVKQWLHQMDVTYQQFPEEPKGSYDLAFIQLVGTMVQYNWKKEELNRYLSKIIGSLKTESILVMIEIEKTDNVFAEMYLKEVLGFPKVPGITETELKDIVQKFNLKLIDMKKEKGILFAFSKNP